MQPVTRRSSPASSSPQPSIRNAALDMILHSSGFSSHGEDAPVPAAGADRWRLRLAARRAPRLGHRTVEGSSESGHESRRLGLPAGPCRRYGSRGNRQGFDAMITVFGIRNCDTMRRPSPGSRPMPLPTSSEITRATGVVAAELPAWNRCAGWQALLNTRGLTLGAGLSEGRKAHRGSPRGASTAADGGASDADPPPARRHGRPPVAGTAAPQATPACSVERPLPRVRRVTTERPADGGSERWGQHHHCRREMG